MNSASSLQTRQQILDFAINHLEERDEMSLRIMDVSSTVGVSPSAIYAHFRSREGLIEEAYLAMFRDSSVQILKMIEASLERGLETGSFTDSLFDFLHTPGIFEQTRKRQEIRTRAVALSFTRSGFRRQIELIERETRDALDAIYQRAMDAGLLGKDRSPRQWAAFFRAVVIEELIYVHLDGREPARPWNEFVNDSVEESKRRAAKTPPPASSH
jgi:AcrR family transcriptional regulator